MSQTQTRRAKLTDVPAITQLVAELGYPATPGEMGARLERLLSDPRQFIALAIRGDAVLGLVAAAHRLVLESGDSVEIVGLVVAERARKQGIGGRLVELAESWARGRGITAMRVRSNVTRTQSHPFYESLGYVRQKTQHVYAKRIDAGP